MKEHEIRELVNELYLKINGVPNIYVRREYLSKIVMKHIREEQ